MRSAKSVEMVAPSTGRFAEILTPEAVAFVVGLQRTFNEQRNCWRRAPRDRRGWMQANVRISSKRRSTFVSVSGPSLRCLPICWIDGWRLPGLWTGR
jgi:hypothetical protein